jgi:lipopolysaccharide export system ATP-binding protein
VKDVSVYVRSGETVGLLGPNGAGKTTTFYMMVGLVSADTGIISLNNSDITQEPMYIRARLGIGYLPQEASVFRKLTVTENIMAILETIEGLSEADRNYKLEELLTELGLHRVAKSMASALSGGERRRVEIARALCRSPNFILLDEPFAGIDPIVINDIQAIIAHLRSKGIGVLITDHNVRETLGICDRAYILAEGRILIEGSPEKITSDEQARKYYLGEGFSM